MILNLAKMRLLRSKIKKLISRNSEDASCNTRYVMIGNLEDALKNIRNV